MRHSKHYQQSDQNSLIFEYPFLMSSIKKPENQQRESLFQRQSGYKMNFQSESPISRSPSPQNSAHKNRRSPESDINDDSSIELYEDYDEIDQTTEREIKELETQINYKLNEQYNLLRQKLKIKSREREDALKNFRQLSTLQPLKQKLFEDNIQANDQQRKQQRKHTKKKPLDTKSIKNRIIRKIQASENIQPLKNEPPIMTNHKPHQLYSSKHQNIAFNYTFKFQNLSSNTQQTSELLKTIKHKEVQSITKINHSDDVIRQMSEELRKMEFRKVEDIAKGKFSSLRKK